MNKKYVILGGGSAGWMTALTVKKMFPYASVTMIHSKSIGIIGVGEATTPHIVNFLNQHNIDPLDVARRTNGTIKHGISFENWNGDGKRYFHDFVEKIHSFRIPGIFDHSCEDYFKRILIAKGLSFEDHIYQQRLAYSGKIDLANTSRVFVIPENVPFKAPSNSSIPPTVSLDIIF
jgi:tryptophan halogenase